MLDAGYVWIATDASDQIHTVGSGVETPTGMIALHTFKGKQDHLSFSIYFEVN